MNSKYALALIALVGVGVFALPATMSLFSGQHSFYNIDATGNQVPCVKCHGDVKMELSSGANTDPTKGPLTPGPHANFQCEYCHRAEPGYASGDNAFGAVFYGNASTGRRTIALTVYDLELENFPQTILAGDTLAQAMVGRTIHGGAAISPPDTANATRVLTLSAEKLIPAYSRTTGLPLDTNPATKNTGLNLGAVNNTTAAWNLTGDRSGPLPLLYGAGSKAVNPGTNYHAASLVSCMECHRGEEPYGHYTRITENGSAECANCHYGSSSSARWLYLAAGGFNLTNDPLDTGAAEAHNALVKQNTLGILRFEYNTSNAGCVACHTHVPVDINFEKMYKLKFDAVAFSDGNWATGGFAAEGNVTVSVYGNGSGDTWAVGNKSMNWVPTGSTVYINGTGAQVIGLTNDNDDSAAALTT